MDGWMNRYIFYYLIAYTVIALAQGEDLNQLSFIGMIGMWDPPRIGVISAISELTNGGVDVKMITGDSLETAQAIGMIHLSIIYMAIYPSIYSSYLMYLSFIYIPSIHPSMYPFIHQSIHLSIQLSIHQSIHLSIHQSIHLSIHQSIHLSIYKCSTCTYLSSMQLIILVY